MTVEEKKKIVDHYLQLISYELITLQTNGVKDPACYVHVGLLDDDVFDLTRDFIEYGLGIEEEIIAIKRLLLSIWWLDNQEMIKIALSKVKDKLYEILDKEWDR